MTMDRRTVRLGFADGAFPVGTHICQIFGDDVERQDALMAFLLSGLQDGERTACFSEKVDPSALGNPMFVPPAEYLSR